MDNTLVEEKLVGHSHTKIISWIKRNGFKYTGQKGVHPTFTHSDTNYSIPGVNPHKGDVNPHAVGNILGMIKTHHEKNKLTYHPINEVVSFSEFLSEKLSADVMYHSDSSGEEIGSTIHKDDRTSVMTKNIPLHKLMPYEDSAEKIKGVHSRQVVDSLVNTIKSGKRSDIPPITVMKHPVLSGHYIVLDGHHRYEAHKKTNSKLVKAEIVPDKNISYDNE